MRGFRITDPWQHLTLPRHFRPVSSDACVLGTYSERAVLGIGWEYDMAPDFLELIGS